MILRVYRREPAARDLQAFLVFSQHPKWVHHAGKLIEKALYCFYEITMLSSCKERTLLYFCADQVAYSRYIHRMMRENQSKRLYE